MHRLLYDDFVILCRVRLFSFAGLRIHALFYCTPVPLWICFCVCDMSCIFKSPLLDVKSSGFCLFKRENLSVSEHATMNDASSG